jgi:very-short-patch-repair endonuclease
MRARPLTFDRARQLRRRMSLPEVVLWEALRGGRLGDSRFRRQHRIGPYILDFFCPAARIAVEVDGSVHLHEVGARRDVTRDRWLAAQEIRVLRFPASEVLKDGSRADVLGVILDAAGQGTGSSSAKRGRGTMRSMVEGARR